MVRIDDQRSLRAPTTRETPRVWPRRLLHVPTMTSYERDAKNAYNNIREPQYNAISYTWGRFEGRNRPAIKILGVTWDIPGIKSSHFTVNEFQVAINRAADGMQFLWLDVACIDQKNNSIKLDEINRQAAIFRGAKAVFAWITPWETGRMLRSLHILDSFAPSQQGFGMEYKLQPFVAVGTVDRRSLHEAVADIAGQGWFTSLWTLQEAWLSQPYIMSRSCDTVQHVLYRNGQETGHAMPVPISLTFISASFRMIWVAFYRDNTPESQAMCKMIIDSGLLSINSRNQFLLYRAAAKRQARLPQDAVYGIMQVYDICMPESNDVDRLLTDFALVLNNSSPVGSQLFVHEAPVDSSKAWIVSRNTTIPLVFAATSRYRNTCRVEGSHRKPLFTSVSTTAHDLVDFWTSLQVKQRGSQNVPFLPHIYLDASRSTPCQFIQIKDEFSPPQPDLLKSLEDATTKVVLPADLPNLLPHHLGRYRVLRLGSVITDVQTEDNSSDEAWDLEYHIGLLLVQIVEGKGKPWSRVGYCSWMASSQRRMNTPLAQTVIENPEKIGVPWSTWEKGDYLLA
ncbi:hypothetical protein EDB80DRAFT_727752 [Ilyonectria destructans]|nr:hypothetical protein EDB80DRAFT_727752 [Ilyonectria destructans]